MVGCMAETIRDPRLQSRKARVTDYAPTLSLCLLRRRLPERATHRILPAAPLATPCRRVHQRLEAAVEPPRRRKARQVGAKAGLPAREVGGAERGRLHD